MERLKEQGLDQAIAAAVKQVIKEHPENAILRIGELLVKSQRGEPTVAEADTATIAKLQSELDLLKAQHAADVARLTASAAEEDASSAFSTDLISVAATPREVLCVVVVWSP